MRRLFITHLLIARSALALAVSDSFDDGVIDGTLWSVDGRKGEVIESDGVANFVMEESNSSSYAVLGLKKDIPLDSDFSISADLLYNNSPGDDFIFGFVLKHFGAVQKSTSTYNMSEEARMSAQNLDPIPDFFLGPQLDGSPFNLEFDYTAENRLISFTVTDSNSVLGTITHSINNLGNADLNSAWAIDPGDFLRMEISAESFSNAINAGSLAIDSFELSFVPEPNFYGLFVGLFLCGFIARRKYERYCDIC